MEFDFWFVLLTGLMFLFEHKMAPQTGITCTVTGDMYEDRRTEGCHSIDCLMFAKMCPKVFLSQYSCLAPAEGLSRNVGFVEC